MIIYSHAYIFQFTQIKISLSIYKTNVLCFSFWKRALPPPPPIHSREVLKHYSQIFTFLGSWARNVFFPLSDPRTWTTWGMISTFKFVPFRQMDWNCVCFLFVPSVTLPPIIMEVENMSLKEKETNIGGTYFPLPWLWEEGYFPIVFLTPEAQWNFVERWLNLGGTGASQKQGLIGSLYYRLYTFTMQPGRFYTSHSFTHQQVVFCTFGRFLGKNCCNY